MASHIWLGALMGRQQDAVECEWFYPQSVVEGKATRFLLQDMYGRDGGAAIIAKGNKIEGIEARY